MCTHSVPTFPDRLMSSDPTAAIRLGMMRGRMSAFSIRRNSFPTKEMYVISRSVHCAGKSSITVCKNFYVSGTKIDVMMGKLNWCL